jgi:hypothetical protein
MKNTNTFYMRLACVAMLIGQASAIQFPQNAACGSTPPTTAPSAKKVAYAQSVRAQIATVLDTLQNDNDYSVAISSLQALFDQTILYSPEEKFDAIHDADFALRLVTQLSHVPSEDRDELLPYLRKHDNLAQTLVFLNRQDQQRSSGAYTVLNTLRKQRPDKMDAYATLVSAICVVQYRPFSTNMNENRVTSVDPLDIFDYYVKNESRMFFGIKNVPAELLIYVVDTTATVEEMQWALNKYRGNRAVGKLFFDIKYDYAYLKRGTDKTVTVKGYNLPNILQYGGVCVDQAYFATSVGKAIGVPTAVDGGASAEAGHAWAGYLEFNGKTAAWNFNSGRYEAFQGVLGSVLDPQTRKNVPDSYVSLLGEMIGTRAIDRQNAVALTDAAERLITLENSATSDDQTGPAVDAVIATTVRPKPRAKNAGVELALVDQALRQSIAYAPAWFVVRDLAVAKKLSAADKRKWADMLLKLGAQKYPDFTLAVLMPMVKTIDSPTEEDALLSKMLPMFQTRLDLAAGILMTQADLWETQKQSAHAGEIYMEVVERYTNGGPFVITALAGAEKLLKLTNHADRITQLYAQAWARTKKPDGMAQQFVDQSNWFRIGKIYSKKLAEAGDSAKASDVKSTLGI